MALDFTAAVGLGLILFIGVGFMAFWLSRVMQMWTLKVLRDYRNPGRAPFTIKAIFKRQKDIATYWKSTLAFSRLDTVPYWNPEAFGDKKSKTVEGYLAISGRDDDSTFVPRGMTIMSGAAANTFAKNASDNISHELHKAGIDADAEKLSKIFTKDWFMAKFGVVDVENKNLWLNHHKVQIVANKAITTTYEKSNLSFLAQNPMFLMFCMGVIVLAIAAYPIWQASANATSTIDGQAASTSGTQIGQALVQYLSGHGGAGSTVPIANVSNGTQRATSGP